MILSISFYNCVPPFSPFLPPSFILYKIPMFLIFPLQYSFHFFLFSLLCPFSTGKQRQTDRHKHWHSEDGLCHTLNQLCAHSVICRSLRPRDRKHLRPVGSRLPSCCLPPSSISRRRNLCTVSVLGGEAWQGPQGEILDKPREWGSRGRETQEGERSIQRMKADGPAVAPPLSPLRLSRTLTQRGARLPTLK